MLSVSATNSLNIYWGRQEEPAILVSRLLLRTRRMYVASIRLEWMKCSTERNLITRVSTFCVP